MKLSILSVVLGLGVGLPQILGLINPKGFSAAVRRFPRNEGLGTILMLIATAGFLWNVSQEKDADFATMKPMLMIGFLAIGIGACVFVRDFLSVRALAVILLLVAKLLTDSERWLDTEWRLVIAVWAYALVVAGIWFTVAPWRLRDLLNWATATEQRVKVGCVLRLAFGLFIAALGVTVF